MQLNIFDQMITGYGLTGIQPKSKDVRGLSAVLDSVINDKEMEIKSSSIPAYITAFFKHFCLQKEKVLLNIALWKTHKGPYDKYRKVQQYRYFKFLSKFFISDNFDTEDGLNNLIPNFNIFIQIMANLKQIIICSHSGKSISLSDGLFSELMDNIALINSVSHSVFESIQIVEPINDIDPFIAKYGDKFKKQGWVVMKSKFEHVPFNLNTPRSLMIKRN